MKYIMNIISESCPISAWNRHWSIKAAACSTGEAEEVGGISCSRLLSQIFGAGVSLHPFDFISYSLTSDPPSHSIDPGWAFSLYHVHVGLPHQLIQEVEFQEYSTHAQQDATVTCTKLQHETFNVTCTYI